MEATMQDENGRWIICCIKGCDADAIYGGLCVNHHRRNKKYGSPVASKFAAWRWLQLSDEERFWKQVRKSSDCWEWLSGKDIDGYGAFKGEHAGTDYKRAHRYSYALHKGPIAFGMHVCHTCDNPSCVNPAHLFLGTNAVNMADKIAKGRARLPRGEDHSNAKLTREQAEEILRNPSPYTQLAAEYGVSVGTISDIKNRTSWPELGDEKGAKAKRISARRGKSSKGVTPEIVRDIRQSNERGVDLAAKYGLKPQDITDIRKRRSWAHIE